MTTEREIKRISWDEYFMQIAWAVSERSTCPRAKVGAIIVKDKRIISTGYNGAPAGEPHCLDNGCIVIDNHCQRAIHAETNAVAQAAKFGVSVEGATLYYYDSLGRGPESCNKCFQVEQAAGIKEVKFRFKDNDEILCFDYEIYSKDKRIAAYE